MVILTSLPEESVVAGGLVQLLRLLDPAGHRGVVDTKPGTIFILIATRQIYMSLFMYDLKKDVYIFSANSKIV